MTDAEFHGNIRRIWRGHWLHYPAQALLTGGPILAIGRHSAGVGSPNPRFATWPALLLLAALVPLVSVAVYGIHKRLKPNLRRPYEANMRIYQGRIMLRNSLLGLLGLPLLASFLLTHEAIDLVTYAAVLLLLAWQTAPTAQKYQRWLLS
jgi:hypothetical protein